MSNQLPVRFIHAVAALVMALLGVATLLGWGQRWGL